MPTIFVSANDTGVGKTWVTATIARRLLNAGRAVQIVKPVETGVAPTGAGDVEWVENALLGRVERPAEASFFTLRRYTQPLAPVEAAKRDGQVLDFDELVAALNALPETGWRVVEGAGGLAVPLEEGASPRDWADFALAINADWTVLVVEDRLGAINQARLLAAWAHAHDLTGGWWLNQARRGADPAVSAVNRDTLSELEGPLWAVQSFDTLEPEWIETRWLPL